MTASPDMVTKSLKEFDLELEAMGLKGEWHYEEFLQSVIDGPRPGGAPAVWRWPELRAKLVEACDVFPSTETARRNFCFINPEMDEFTTNTLLGGVQMLTPGEIAWTHRHTASALRFVIEGSSQLRTVVNGEVCPMEPYDLVLTPNWTWHDHENGSRDLVAWLDVLDSGLIKSLNAPFYEPLGDERQPVRESESDYIQARQGLIRPAWESTQAAGSPTRYAWKDVEPQLLRMRDSEGTPYDGVVMEYVNPITGGAAMPTMGCWLQLLKPSLHTQAHRHTSSSVYFVVRGEGRTQVEGETLTWSQHDSFCVPSWAWHEHENLSASGDAILFSVNDTPALEALGLYREEPDNTLRTSRLPAAPSLRPPDEHEDSRGEAGFGR